MSISSNQIIKKPDVILNPNFFLPPGVVDARHASEVEAAEEEITEIVDFNPVPGGDIIETPIDDIGSETGPPPTILLPPDSVIVVSQEVRTVANGQQVVDVILEVADVEDSIQVDVRLTKT